MASILRSQDPALMTTKVLYKTIDQHLKAFISDSLNDDSLASRTAWIWDNIIIEQLPILQYTRSKMVMGLSPLHFNWGEMLAGLKWIRGINKTTHDISPEDAISLGNYIVAGIERACP